MGSMKTLSFYPQPSQYRNEKWSKSHNLSISLKLPLCSINPIQFHKRNKLQIPSKPFCMPLILQMPASSLSKTSTNFTKFLSEKVLLPIFWGIIFLGSIGVNSRQSLALAAQTNGSGVNIEEKRDTKMEESEDEGMCEVLKNEPRNLQALKVVVHAKMRKGLTEEALKYVKRLIDIEPEEVEWRLLEAHCYEMMGQLSKAKRSFKEILKDRPLLIRALHGLALVMHKNLEGPAVFDMLYKALEVAHRQERVTEERNIKILIAQMHVVKGELEEALKKFQDLVSENPRDFRPYLCQGMIYGLLDRKDEAAEQFETYRSLVPEEFPQRIFLDDVMLEAKTKSREQFQAEFSHRR